jgi:uncharacterized protein YqjF (DUF2071 family)
MTSPPRPPARAFLRARWCDLIFCSWPVAPELLATHVPRGTTVDVHDGSAWISIVAFAFRDTRMLGLPIPGHVHFPEVNLRTYVRRAHPDGDRRGVVFLEELVPRRAIAWTARALYDEPYHACPMWGRNEVVDERSQARRVTYGWERAGSRPTVSAEFSGAPTALRDGSITAFIAEHYWGYTPRRGGWTQEYQVNHLPWRVWESADISLSADVATYYASQHDVRLVGALRGAAPSVFVAEGSPVTVSFGARIT